MEVCERDPGDKAPSCATPPPPDTAAAEAEVTAVVVLLLVTEPPEGLSDGLCADVPARELDCVLPVVGWLPLVSNCN